MYGELSGYIYAAYGIVGASLIVFAIVQTIAYRRLGRELRELEQAVSQKEYETRSTASGTKAASAVRADVVG